jgi:hypothetical protein
MTNIIKPSIHTTNPRGTKNITRNPYTKQTMDRIYDADKNKKL